MNLCRRKSGARLAELEELVEQLRIKLAKMEKDKVKLQVEIRDMTIAYETVSAALRYKDHSVTETRFRTLSITPLSPKNKFDYAVLTIDCL